MSTSPHAFLTSVLCALWPPACLCPARGDLVEAYLCQRSGKGLQCSVCSKRQGVCLAEKRCLWSADIDWAKDQRGMAMYSVHCSQPGRRGGNQNQSKRRRGGGGRVSQQASKPPCPDWSSGAIVPQAGPGWICRSRRGSARATGGAEEQVLGRQSREGEEEQGSSRANRMRSRGGSHRWSASCAS